MILGSRCESCIVLMHCSENLGLICLSATRDHCTPLCCNDPWKIFLSTLYSSQHVPWELLLKTFKTFASWFPLCFSLEMIWTLSNTVFSPHLRAEGRWLYAKVLRIQTLVKEDFCGYKTSVLTVVLVCSCYCLQSPTIFGQKISENL